MKRQLLITLVGILILLSLAQAGILHASATDSQQKNWLRVASINERNVILSTAVAGDDAAGENNHNTIYRTGAIPTQIIALAGTSNVSTVHVGDQITGRAKLIRTDTGAGIPEATIRTKGSLDNKTFYDLGSEWVITTDVNGETYYKGTIPDPRPYVSLPITVYFKYVYDGNSTYAATSLNFFMTVLPPSTSPTATTTTALMLMQVPHRCTP